MVLLWGFSVLISENQTTNSELCSSRTTSPALSIANVYQLTPVSGLGLQWSPLIHVLYVTHQTDPAPLTFSFSKFILFAHHFLELHWWGRLYSVHFHHHCCRQWQRNCAYDSGDETGEHGERPSDHTLYHSVHLSLIHIHISHTHSYTHNILKNSLPSKCKQNNF